MLYTLAPIAQLDRVLVSEAKGRRFESCWAHQSGMKVGTWLQVPIFIWWMVEAKAPYLTLIVAVLNLPPEYSGSFLPA